MPTIDFPRSSAGLPNRDDGYVYVLSYVLNGVEIPFYVGESGRFGERMEDYECAAFKCPTDFKVGIAIRYLRDECGLKVVVRYEQSDNRKSVEQGLIRDCLLSGYRLLNFLPGYDYNASNAEQESAYVRAFCDLLLNRNANAANAAGS
jgi:hypothetical protein